MGQKVLSICVEQKFMKIAEVSRDSAKSVTVTKLKTVDTPSAAYEDGLILEPSQIVECIKKVIAEEKIKVKKLVFSINSKKIAVKEIIVPNVKNQKKMSEILNANASEYFPMSNVEDYVFGYNTMEIIEEDGLKKQRVYGIAAPKEILKGYYAISELLKMPIESIDFTGNSALQVLGMQAKAGTSLILQILEDTTVVNIMKNGVMVLQRSAPYGKASMVEALSDMKGITLEQAEEMIENPDVLNCEVQPEEYHEAASYFVNSVVRIIEYYGSIHKDTHIDEFLYFGAGSNISGIEEMLSTDIGIQAVKLELSKGINFKSKDEENVYIQDYIENIGAVIRPVGLLLLQEDPAADAAKVDRYFYLGMIGAAVIAIVWCTLTALEYFSSVDEKKEYEDKIAGISGIEEIVSEYKDALAIGTTLEEFYESTMNANEMASYFLRDLEKIIPSSLGIGSLNFNSGIVSMTATCSGKLDAAKMILQLKSLGYVTDISIPSISETYDELGIATTTFSISCILHNVDINLLGGTEE